MARACHDGKLGVCESVRLRCDCPSVARGGLRRCPGAERTRSALAAPKGKVAAGQHDQRTLSGEIVTGRIDRHAAIRLRERASAWPQAIACENRSSRTLSGGSRTRGCHTDSSP